MGLQDQLKSFRDNKLDEEKQKGTDFLSANKNNPGVTELPNSIQYLVVKEGSGEKPNPNSKIKAHYRGKLLNGKEFDSSYKRNQPFSASLTSLIRGWQEVIPLMPVGSIW